MIKLLFIFLVSFAVSLILMPCVIKFFRARSVQQTILSYVTEHKNKNGTLTMGGVVFVLTSLLVSFFFLDFSLDWFIVLLVSVFFGVLGFMDDFIKIKYNQNLGLRPYQKIVGQVGISIVFAVYIYLFVSTKVYLPFTISSLDFKFWIIPFVILVLLSTTNSVNLTDGLDGLAGSTSFVYLIFFVIITTLTYFKLYNSGETGEILQTIQDINVLSVIFAGAILGFLMFNTSKASIFMGDVGSLCLGGFIASSACMIGQALIIPVLGLCFVFSALSVILQVVSYKTTKKRIFKMAPFHHHLQQCGLSEPKIVLIYSSVTLCLGIVGVIITLM